MRRFLRHLLAISYSGLIFIAFVIGGFFLTNFIVGKIVLSKDVVEVPEFVGVDIDNAKEISEYLSLHLEVADYEYSELPQGRIISQIPSHGRSVYKNRAISVIVSGGTKRITIPVMTGFSYSNIQDIFGVYELKLGDVIQHYSSTVPNGYVINTVPAFGTTVMAGRPVDVIVSIGQDPLEVQESDEFDIDALIDDYSKDEPVF